MNVIILGANTLIHRINGENFTVIGVNTCIDVIEGSNNVVIGNNLCKGVKKMNNCIIIGHGFETDLEELENIVWLQDINMLNISNTITNSIKLNKSLESFPHVPHIFKEIERYMKPF